MAVPYQTGRKHCGKGEIAHYEQFLLIPHKTCAADTYKQGFVWERIKLPVQLKPYFILMFLAWCEHLHGLLSDLLEKNGSVWHLFPRKLFEILLYMNPCLYFKLKFNNEKEIVYFDHYIYTSAKRMFLGVYWNQLVHLSVCPFVRLCIGLCTKYLFLSKGWWRNEVTFSDSCIFFFRDRLFQTSQWRDNYYRNKAQYSC